MEPKQTIALSPAALAQLHDYQDDLSRRGLLHDSDFSSLIRLVQLEEQADALTAHIARTGATAIDPEGTERRNPALLALVNVQTLITQLRRNLSLGAYFRARDTAEKIDYDNDPLIKLMYPDR
jgi:phage terminase small subunit